MLERKKLISLTQSPPSILVMILDWQLQINTSGTVLAQQRNKEMWRFPGKEGRRNLPVTALWADGYPHQLKANKERRGKNNRVQDCCLDKHSVKLLWYLRRVSSFLQVEVLGRSQNNSGCVRVLFNMSMTHNAAGPHSPLVCGISRFKIG